MWIYIGISLVVGGYVVYTQMKVREVRKDLINKVREMGKDVSNEIDMHHREALNKLKEIEDTINSFPTPDELAKEIMKIKIPLSDLPKDMANKIKNMSSMMPPDEPSGDGPPVPMEEIDKQKKSNYIG